MCSACGALRFVKEPSDAELRDKFERHRQALPPHILEGLVKALGMIDKIIALVDDRDHARLRLAESGVVTDHVTRSNVSTELVGTLRRALGGLSLSRRRWAGRASGAYGTVELLTTSGGADLLA